MERRPNGSAASGVAVMALALVVLAASGCAGLNRSIDRWALETKARTAVERAAPTSRRPLPYASAEALEVRTRPAGLPAVELALQTRYRLDATHLVQETLTFASAVRLALPGSERAVAHVYRHGPLGERPVLLWVPGQAIQASDFTSLGEYFTRALERGFDVVFFVPPYHLERSPAGFASGDAFLATGFADHLEVFAQELSDLRRLVAWLRARGVRTLGAFGSSMGGGMLLRIATWDPTLDFLLLKQPLVDWNTVMRRPEMAPVRERILGQGYTAREIAQGYRALDARRAKPRLDPARIALLQGRYDQIAAPENALSLARRWGIRRVRLYRRGHSLITLGGGTYRDVATLLDEELRAAGWQTPPGRERLATRHPVLLVD